MPCAPLATKLPGGESAKGAGCGQAQDGAGVDCQLPGLHLARARRCTDSSKQSMTERLTRRSRVLAGLCNVYRQSGTFIACCTSWLVFYIQLKHLTVLRFPYAKYLLCAGSNCRHCCLVCRQLGSRKGHTLLNWLAEGDSELRIAEQMYKKCPVQIVQTVLAVLALSPFSPKVL